MATIPTVAGSDSGPPVSFREALLVWLRVAALSFGGPAGQIAVMHRILVEEKRWISEERFLHALNYCMLLPGPEAQQLATYAGWLLHRTAGGLAAGLLFILPGFLSILALSLLYAGFQEVGPVQALFYGIKAAVLAVVLEAVVRIGRRALKTGAMVMIAGGAFVAIFLFQMSFPLIILCAGLLGLGLARWQKEVPAPVASVPAQGSGPVLDALLDERGGNGGRLPSALGTLRVAGTWLAIWLLPVACLALLAGGDSVYTRIAEFFSRVAVLSFGGAYAVLAWVAQEAVQGYGWLEPGEMLDGLGMAETTPGPLIQVTQFVAFMAAFRDSGGLDPWAGAVFASVLVTWVTFAPCFLWIFAGAPYIERLRGHRGLNAALSAITAAVVGVILNLAVWFSLHVLFAELAEWRAGPVLLRIPVAASADPAAMLLAAGSLLALLRYRVGMIPVIFGSAALGAAWYLLRAG